MLPISVCIIAKNEEKYIAECLRRLSAYPWEIILVDTGSTDCTVSLASPFVSHIYHYEWQDDFSAAKNYAVSKASHDWILNVDCDEMLEEYPSGDILSTLTELIAQKPSSYLGSITLKNLCYYDGSLSNTTESIVRYFNKQHYSYTGAVHEQITSKLSMPLYSFQLPFTFTHLGYQEPDIRKTKSLRNIALLEKELAAMGANPYLYFHIGQSYFVMQDMEKAQFYFDKGLSMDVNPSLDYVQTMVESYGHCLLHLHRYEQALQFENIYDTFCLHADFVFLMGLIYMNNAMFDKAINEFKKAASTASYSVDGVNSYKAFYNIGVIYECTGHPDTAGGYYRKCGCYPPALAAMERIR